MDSQRPYQICVRCVMDTTTPEIQFDGEGVCSFCHAYRESAKALLPELEAKAHLQKVIANMKELGSDREYDCILGVSGGVDSSYLATKLKEFGLRVLAVQFDNGWNSELAVRNIELLCKKLDMDLFTYVVDWEEFRDLQLAFLKASVANVEAPSDHGIFACLYRIAYERGIRYVASGNNIVTEQICVPSYGYMYRDLRQIRGIHHRFGTKKLKTFPKMGFFKSLFYQRVAKIQTVTPLNDLQYNKAEAIKILERDFGWKYYGGKHHESIITRFHQAYILPRKFGLDKRRAHLSNLIFSNQLTRNEAIEELKLPISAPELIIQDREYVIKKLGISEQDFETIMSQPSKSYRDYPNEEWLYKIYIASAKVKSNLLGSVFRKRISQ